MNKRALIAMSGGVDSAVSAYLMKERGFECTGVTMKLFNNEDVGVEKEKACCSLRDVEDARSVANRLDMPYYVFNFVEEFKGQVIERFVEAYEGGLTPNPCIDCNRHLKFSKLFSRAKQLDIDYIVTGHYARTEWDEVLGRYILKKAVDPLKDQSYVLYFMSQEQLKHTIFPLGELLKSQTREIAAEQGFVNAQKSDSQDICFVKDNDYAGFIEQYRDKVFNDGDFLDRQGNVIGKHKGLIRYTVGQRKGIGISLGRPMYVCSKCTKDNTVTLCDNEELYEKSFQAVDFNWIAIEKADKPIRVKAKVRYKHPEKWATVEQASDGTVHIEFDEPERAIAPGQAVVLYDGDVVVGGGTISSLVLDNRNKKHKFF